MLNNHINGFYIIVAA